MSGGTVRKRTWKRNGRKRTSWGWTLGKDQTRRQGFASREEAQADLDAYRAKIATPAPAESASGLTLGEAFTRYLALKSRKKTSKEYARQAEILKAAFGESTPLAELDASRISAYREARLQVRRNGALLSPAAINRPLAVLRNLLRVAAREWGVIETVPFIAREPERKGRLRWLTPEEATRLLDACRQSGNRALVDVAELALYTGMRRGEVLSLTWGQVDRSRGVVRLERTKTDEPRDVPLNGPADAVLARRWTPGAEGLVFPSSKWDTYRSAWRRAVRVARVHDFRFHDTRHTAASWMVQHGASLQEVKDILGHSNLTMTLRYAHLAPGHLRSAVARLDRVLAAPRTDHAQPVTGSLAGREIEAKAAGKLVSRGGIEPPTP